MPAPIELRPDPHQIVRPFERIAPLDGYCSQPMLSRNFANIWS